MSYNEHLTTGLAGLWNCTTNEAAERVAPKRKRLSHDSVRGDVPWTAARCNRLLRTINSRVNLLRKQSKLGKDNPSTRPAESIKRQGLEAARLEETPSPRADHRTQANDPAWLPGLKWKATARTYGKPKPQAIPAPQRADSGFSTPFVKGLLKDEISLNVEQSSNVVRSDDGKRQPMKMRQLPVQLASSNEEAQRNLVAAFNNLLTTTTTTSPSEPERTGARSLMSSCLSRVPHYIDLEAEDVYQSNVDAEDIVSSIYTDLESLGTNSDGGWSGLREVVRSHCVHLICTAIKEGLIHDARISELVTTCNKNGALPEAESVLRSWITHHRTGNFTRIDESHYTIAKLAEIRTSHDASELYLRQFTRFIGMDLVSVVDVLRPGCTSLKDLIKALIRGPGQDIALDYLEAAVMKDCETSNTTCLPVFMRLAGLLASIALTRAGTWTESSNDLDLPAVVHRIAIRVMQHQTSKHQRLEAPHHPWTETTRRSNALHPFIMADTLLQLAALPKLPSIACTTLKTAISSIAEHQHAFVKFVCNVAQHVSRFSEADEIESLLLTTSGFLNPPPECNNEDRDLLGRLALEIAFAFSEQTGVDIDHRFADTLAAGSKNPDLGNNLLQTPRRRVQVSGFKWEEGLCEWVAATPIPLNRAAQAEPIEQGETLHQKQAPEPKQNAPDHTPRKSQVLVLPSSPDIIAVGEQHLETPKHSVTTLPLVTAQPSRPALKERSSNQPLPSKQVRFSSGSTEKDQERNLEDRPARHLKPVIPKQVHLKVERAKRASLLLAQTTSHRTSILASTPAPTLTQAPSRQLRRSLSFADNNQRDCKAGESRSKDRIVLAESDELGLLTPARKKRRSTRSGARSLPHYQDMKKQRLSSTLPMRTAHDGLSDDELGL